MLKALTDAPHIEAVDVIVLHDAPSDGADRRYFGSRGASYVACGGDRRALVARVVRASLAGRYDLMIAGHVNLAPLLLGIGAWQRRAQRVTYIHGTDAWSPLPWLRRSALRRSHRVIAVSQFTATTASSANDLDPTRVSVVHNCLDPLLATCDADADHDVRVTGSSSLLTVSRLSRAEASKGQTTVLHALREVVPYIPNLTYTIVGEGDLKPDLVQLINTLGLQQHVRLLGQVPDAELRRLYHTCTAYVMPSKWEGFGLVFLEAMAHARPIIAGRRDAAPEVLADAALLVDPGDVTGLARTLRRLLTDQELQARLGKAGQARLKKYFTYERFREALLAEIDDLRTGQTACRRGDHS
jgi:glycosyltransferase involved in cell wall biosynthesis